MFRGQSHKLPLRTCVITAVFTMLLLQPPLPVIVLLLVLPMVFVTSSLLLILLLAPAPFRRDTLLRLPGLSLTLIPLLIPVAVVVAMTAGLTLTPVAEQVVVAQVVLQSSLALLVLSLRVLEPFHHN